MPPREFDQRRLLAGVDHGQIVVRATVTGIKLDGLAQCGFRGAAQSLVAERKPEMILDVGALWIELGSAAESVERGIVFFLTKSNLAQDGQGVSVVGVNCQRFLYVVLRFVEPVEFELD